MTLPRLANMVRQKPRQAGAASLAALVVLFGGTSLIVSRRAEPPWPVATAREGRFVDAIVETGTITAARLMLHGTTIAGASSKIAELVPEGVRVATGDLLIRFDATPFEQSLQREVATLRQAEADVTVARQALQIETLQARSDVEAAAQKVGYAASDLRNETNGKGPLAIAEAEANAAEVGREVERTRTAFLDLKPLLAEGFITKAELDHAEQAWKRAEELQRLADLRRQALVRYERPAAIDRARAEIDRAREELSRERTSAGARLAQRQAALKLAEAKVQELNARVAMLRDQIGRTVVRAQGPGLVVYRDLFFGSDRRKPQIGDEVWPNQPLFGLPDSSQLTVETRVREIDLHKITARGRVIVRVDAYPDLRLRASVGLVGALAQEDVARAGTRFFPVTIALMDGDARLRPGMTAQVEIDVASIDRATIVPSQAVFEREGRRFCFVVRRGRPEQTPVTLAADNGIDAAIKQGLRAGDVVLLAEPATAGFEARP